MRSRENNKDNLSQQSKAIKGKVDDYIRKNPLESVLIAAGIGALAGAILASLMMRRKR